MFRNFNSQIFFEMDFYEWFFKIKINQYRAIKILLLIQLSFGTAVSVCVCVCRDQVTGLGCSVHIPASLSRAESSGQTLALALALQLSTRFVLSTKTHTHTTMCLYILVPDASTARNTHTITEHFRIQFTLYPSIRSGREYFARLNDKEKLQFAFTIVI